MDQCPKGGQVVIYFRLLWFIAHNTDCDKWAAVVQ
jgi:hypothetical protein